MNDKFMKEAIRRAKKAAAIGELPVGAVIVRDGRVIAGGYNTRETKGNAINHAEITAINRACKRLGGWRLTGCDMYVTLEPCPMCAGAAINARLDNVYFGAYDEKSGCAKSVMDMFSMNLLSHRLNSEGGIMEDECRELLKEFFRGLREKNKARKKEKSKEEKEL